MLSHMKWTDDQGRTCFFVNAGYPKDAVMFGHSASADDYPKCFNLGTVRIAAEFVGAVKCGAPEMDVHAVCQIELFTPPNNISSQIG